MPSVSQLQLRALTALDQFYSVAELNYLFDQLLANDQLLAGVIDTERIGQANFAYNAPTSSEVEVGQPVYFNEANQQFEPSMLATIRSGGRLYAAASAECWGLVHTKCSPDRAHLLLSGIASVDLSASVGSASPFGKYYLSRSAGQLSDTIDDAIVAPVLLATGSGEVIFRPWFADTFPRYVPHIRTLVTSPAGTAVTGSGATTISNPNPGAAGWLPASHASFGGNQPSGAYFGYNLAADSVLSVAWPPLEPQLCKIYYESGGDLSRGSRVFLGDETSRLIVNEYGIWWMRNCTGQLPWDIPLDGLAGQTTCPKSFDRRMVLEATFGVGQDVSATSVSSLVSRAGWLKVLRRNSTPEADTGDLDLAIDDAQLVGATNDTASLAFKRYLDGKFTRGPVVTSVRSVSNSLSITGEAQLTGGYQYGALELNVTASKDFDLLPVDTQLFGATTEAYEATIAVGLPAGRNTSFVSSFHIPSSVDAGSTVRFILWILAPSNLTLPAGLTSKTRRFGVPVTTLAIPTENDLVLDYTVGTALAAGSYLQIETDLMEVTGGETVYLRIGRAGSGDGVGAEIKVLKHFARFENAE